MSQIKFVSYTGKHLYNYEYVSLPVCFILISSLKRISFQCPVILPLSQDYQQQFNYEVEFCDVTRSSLFSTVTIYSLSVQCPLYIIPGIQHFSIYHLTPYLVIVWKSCMYLLKNLTSHVLQSLHNHFSFMIYFKVR